MMEDQIKIGVSILDAANRLVKIGQLVGNAYSQYEKSGRDFVNSYKGEANENINFLQSSITKDLQLLIQYYSVGINSIKYALQEFVMEDQALASAIESKFEEMIN